ncbi:hypothetical protein ARZXY2_857 [Arthrobacter sp. ZXY-2]|nr:hypothetical protein ARZXY2_857 [Arthrobacter sp. ZXY-2]
MSDPGLRLWIELEGAGNGNSSASEDKHMQDNARITDVS